MVFDKLTQDSIDVLSRAREEATRDRTDFIESEHVLLGLLAHGKGVAHYALAKSGVHLNETREVIDKQRDKSDKHTQTGESAFGESVEKLLASAHDYAMDRGQPFIETEHLLLALLDVKNWRIRDVFDTFAVDVDRVRADIDISVEHLLNTKDELEQRELPNAAGESFENFAATFPEYSTGEVAPLLSMFNEGALRVLILAQQETLRLGHSFVGSEQLLLGCIADQGFVGDLFRSNQITLSRARAEVEKLIGRGTGGSQVNIPFTPRGKTILVDAREKAFRTRSQTVGPEQILLAILEQNKGISERVLDELEAPIGKFEEDILKRLSSN